MAGRQRNDASFVDRFEIEHDVARRLDDLVYPERPGTGGVRRSQPGDAVRAAQRQAEILGPPMGRCPAPVGVGAFASRSRPSAVKGGILAVRRIADERRPGCRTPARPSVGAAGRSLAIPVALRIVEQRQEEPVAAGEVAVDAVIEEPRGPPFQFGNFFVGERRARFELLRPSQAVSRRCSTRRPADRVDRPRVRGGAHGASAPKAT